MVNIIDKNDATDLGKGIKATTLKIFTRLTLFLLFFLLIPASLFAQWVQTSGPYGGNIYSFTMSGTNLLAGTLSNGVFVSTNNGSSWTSTGLNTYNVRSFVVAGSNVFAGTSGGVFISTDNGLSWNGVNTGLANSNVQALIMSGTILFAGTNGGGVFLSAHNGATWSAANTGISTVNVQALVMSGTNLFAGTNGNGVYLSTNNGTSWTAVNTGLGSSNIQALLVSGTNLFAGTDAGVYLSTNNGTSWTLVNNGLTSTNVIGLVMNGSNLFAGTSAGNIFLSTNNGATWTLKGTIYNILTLFFNGTNFFAGTNGGGAYISTDNGANWNAINKGLTANNIFALTTSSSNILAGTGNGIFLSTDNGTSWNTSLANSYVRSFATNGTMIAAGSPGNGVYVSTDNGTSWTLSTTGLTNNNIYAVAFCGTKLFASAYGTGIFVSTDNGTSWSSIGSGLTNTNVFTFAVNGTNLFAGTIGGGVFLSTDNGANWSAMNTPRLTNLNVRTLVFNGSNLFAGTDGGGIFLSTNNGTSWAWVKTGLAADTSVYVMKTSGTNLFAATNEGVFLSTNNGTNWSAVNTNLTSTNIHSLEINNGFLFSGPFGGVVWRRPLSEMVPGPPTITSFSPTSGPIGTTVTITGTNFNTITANNIVYFGAVKAVVTTASTTSLNVTLPTGVTYQPISVTVNGLTAYTSAPFVVTFTGGGAISNSSFFTKLDFTTGTVPYSVAIGDVDGDGKPDIITANYGNSTISVFRNTCTIANVSFAAKLDFTTGTNPYSVAIGDVDGDGKPDLVVANFNSSTVSVFRNTSTIGSVSFAAKVDFPTGPGAYSVAIGDVDGDGKPDLIVANYSSSTVSIFRNTSTIGSVSFAAKVDFPTMLYPYNVAIGDVDGDGKPDLVVANSGSSTVSVLRNTGTIGSVSFADRMDFTTGSTPYSVAIGDVDGDGRPDLTVANYYSNTVSILRNTSTIGSVSFATKVDFTTGTNPQSIAIGDVDGDGKPDLAVANALSNTVSVLRNTSTIGSVSFAAKVDFTTGSSACSVAIGDVDGDGKPDLVVANYSSNTVSVFRNTINSGNTPPATPQNLTAAAGNGQVTLKWRKNTESDFLKYCIYMGTDSVNVLLKDSTSASISDTTKTITGLTNGTMYYFRVSALDSARLESGKSIAVGTMPQAPSTDLVLTPFSVSGKYINEQIAADTLANGWVTNRAYVLQRGGVYLCNTSINVPPGRKLNIRSDYNSSQHYDPIIYLYPPSGSARPPSYFVQLAGGTINLKRVLLSGYYEPNIVGLDSIQGGFLDVIAGTTTSNIYIDSCILKTTDGSHIRTDGKPVTIRVTNTIFADMGNIATGLSNFGAGRAIDLRDQDVDTCDIQNCTFVNAQDRIVRHYQSTAPIHNFIFNHNTVVNLMSYHGFLSLGMVDATGSGILQIKNNLLIDHFALGADTAYVRQQEFSDPQENDPLNGLPRMAWVLTNPNNTARWDISNNYFAISDSGNAMRTLSAAKGYIPRGHSGTDPQLTWKMNSVFASQGKDTTATFRQVTIAPASIPLLMTKMIRWIYTPRSAGGAGKEKPSSDPNYTKVSPGIWTYDYNRELLTWYYDVLDCSYRANQLLPSSDGKVAGDTRWRFNGIIGGITTPAAPQNLIATAGDAQVLLKWKKNTETDFLKYRVYIGTDSVSVLLKDSTSSSISDTTRTITGLTNGTTYYFRVSALDSTRLESSKSIAVSATPSSAIKILGEYTSDANTVLLLHMDE
ncbi:MAG: FG-GAP-like repeat-containing protein, partial [Bacteroidota bacterium]